MIVSDEKQMRGAPFLQMHVEEVCNGFIVQMNGRPFVLQAESGDPSEIEAVLDFIRSAYEHMKGGLKNQPRKETS